MPGGRAISTQDLFWPFIEFATSCGGLIVATWLVRVWVQGRVDKMRRTYELHMPSTMGPAEQQAFLRSLSGLPRPKFLKPVYAPSFEVYADGDDNRLRYFLHTPGEVHARLDELFLAHTNGTMELVSPANDPILNRKWQDAAELTMTGRGPLRIVDVEKTSVSMGAQFRNLMPGEAIVLQWILYPDTPQRAGAANKEKVADHTFHAIARLGAIGERPHGMVDDLYSVFQSTHSDTAHFSHRVVPKVGERINERSGTLGFPLFMNAEELSALFGWALDGTGPRTAKRLGPVSTHDRPNEDALPIGTSNAPKAANRQVAIPVNQMLKHTWIIGPTGSGKSVLLENIVQGAIQRGMGLFLLEPKGDLARAVLKAIPKHRQADVIWFDPTDRAMPIGLNILHGSDPSRVTGHVVSMFKNLSGDAWGPQLQRVMRNAVYTAALNDLTLYDVRQLLVNKEYRTQQVKRINRKKHPDVLQEWRWLDEKSDVAVDSTVTRLDAFLGDPMIKHIVSQKGGLDMDAIVRERKILLCPLPAAVLGGENASALGQLLWDAVIDATFRRPAGHQEEEPNLLVADEYQNYATMSMTTSDPWSEIRSKGLGLVAANQYTKQLKPAVCESVSNNAQNVFTFSLSPGEAEHMKKSFLPLTAEDLGNLPQYTVAAHVMSSSGRAPTVTLKTAPPPLPTGLWHSIVEHSRKTYGRPVEEVEAELLTRHALPETKVKHKFGELEGL